MMHAPIELSIRLWEASRICFPDTESSKVAFQMVKSGFSVEKQCVKQTLPDDARYGLLHSWMDISGCAGQKRLSQFKIEYLFPFLDHLTQFHYAGHASRIGAR